MNRVVVVLAMLGIFFVTSAETGCGAAEKTPTPPDKVIAKRDPVTSTKHCWELRVARQGRNDKVDLLCVGKKVWDRYAKGNVYP